jgi:2-polyprenyl-3-methyl-5-hydroxy-6-metoxy-1,4-benzoquinol methylase
MGEIPVVEKPCILCGEREYYPLNTFLFNDRRFHTVRCRQDGMMWLDPQPTEQFYNALYSQHYHTTGQDDPLLEQATLDVHSNLEERKRIGRMRVAQIEQFCPPGRFLEVGFGSGATLEAASLRGWDVLGLELDQDCVDRMNAQGIRAINSSLLRVEEAPGSLDVIGLYSVIEHTLDPAAFLIKARELLKEGGILVMRLPDTDDEGPPASLIAHVYHFNTHTIAMLLRRCGFEVLQLSDFGLWKPKRYPGALWNMNVISRKPHL